MRRTGYLVGNDLQVNDIFNLSSLGNRDNCYEPYFRLQQAFRKFGIDLNTYDLIGNNSPMFFLEQNIQPAIKGNVPKYALLWETGSVWPQNDDLNNYSRYSKIFTWRDDLVDGLKFIKLNFPNPISVHAVDGVSQRPLLATMIAGNKTVVVPNDRELYSERVRVIRWFESNAPEDFALYGVGWDRPQAKGTIFSKLIGRSWRLASRFIELKPFPSYRGCVGQKREVLQMSRFAICYENVCDLPGYITEKIFDCFFAGCVPVYWGASNITEYVPQNCFIDRRLFKDIAEVYNFLKSLSEDEYRVYQQNIANFLSSDAIYPFSSEAFAETIVSTIVNDLGATK